MTGRRYDDILATIGRTPVVRLAKLAPPGINLYAKLESFNPMGSVKDRLALGVIEDAERSGKLQPGQTVVEATSGNTGIGLAMVCARKGYPLVVTMAENFSVERRKLLRFLGAKVVLTPAALKGSGMLAKAVELAETHDWFLCRQFENEANADAHSRTTAPEIIADFEGERLDYWVTGYGTGGTLKGVARVLRDKRPDTRIVVCEPDNAQMLGSGIPQVRATDGSPAESHPLFRPHLMQGWSPDFIPRLTEDALAEGLVDEVVPVNGADALGLAKALAQQEGIFVGISGGATLAGALRVAESAPAGSTILCMLPDTGERYLSTPLFEGVSVDMSPDELEISRSTPNYRFDKPAVAPASPAAAAEAIAAPADAIELVRQTISDRTQPVTIYALEWCEFCWSARKMFARYEIPYRSVDLDSVAYQADNLGGRIRAALAELTGARTIPQIFVGGEHVGGATELFDAVRSGALQALLEKYSVPYNRDVKDDPYTFLPGWLHAR
ncbi:MAG: pyridoxal-phosphate dependent enzyme [Gammaproteobacteria bacterium]|nr:pyridoxal-phosphate dependent enzyme [Gammaproteobacteria bacterium]MDH4253014.1 pyridoxal-phosphate dependent enzyme [Gammaproteobacteria bacterium]MDH5308564.1 pyridoxal-phosphate dependent enzyme [Gammaproteobacteria bacterium]